MKFARLVCVFSLGLVLFSAFANDEGVLDRELARQICRRFTQSVAKRPGQRPVFTKQHGCARATFTVLDGLPEEFRVGLFEKSQVYQAWVRFSSDTSPKTSDFEKNTIGLSVKVLDVGGAPKVLPGEENDPNHDFLLQNHNVFFVDTAKDFMEFTDSIFTGTDKEYLAAHEKFAGILKAMEKDVSNVLESKYWSTVPYRLGAGYAKYKVVPCVDIPGEGMPGAGDDNYLKTRLSRDMKTKGACFQFQVQRRTGQHMPLDQATVEWSEEESRPLTVAVIQIQPQDIHPNSAKCEHMSFTAWHAFPEHRPVGTVQEARGLVYKYLADLRRLHGGVPPPNHCE